MTVYVDDMYLTQMGRFGRMRMSHMIADTPEELRAMADTIGLARRHIQYEGHPAEHFDVSMEYRARAISAGATPITMRDLARKIRDRKMAYLEHYKSAQSAQSAVKGNDT